MKLNFKAFTTPGQLTDFVNSERIRPEQIQSITDSIDLLYWDDCSLKVDPAKLTCSERTSTP